MLGMPVLCTNVGGCSTLIQHEVNGFLLPDNDPFMWACLINNLYGDQVRLQSIGSAARASALVRHNDAEICRSLLQIYKCIQKTEGEKRPLYGLS